MMHKNIFKSIYYLCYVDFVLMINRGSNTFYLLLFRQKKMASDQHALKWNKILAFSCVSLPKHF